MANFNISRAYLHHCRKSSETPASSSASKRKEGLLEGVMLQPTFWTNVNYAIRGFHFYHACEASCANHSFHHFTIIPWKYL